MKNIFKIAMFLLLFFFNIISSHAVEGSSHALEGKFAPYYTGVYDCMVGQKIAFIQIEVDNEKLLLTFNARESDDDNTTETEHYYLSFNQQSDARIERGKTVLGDGSLVLLGKYNAPALAIKPLQDKKSLENIETIKNIEISFITNQGYADYQCPSFFVVATQPAKGQYEAVLNLLKNEKPTIEMANAAYIAQLNLPPITAISRLDQKNTLNEYERLSEQFWKNFSKTEIEHLNTMPINTKEQQAALLATMHQALEFWSYAPPHRNWWENQKEFVTKALTTVNDRFVIHGIKPEPIDFTKSEMLCNRLDQLENTNAFFTNASLKWELTTGLSGEYWDKEFAEKMLTLAEKCENSRYAESFQYVWPEFLERQQQVDWLLKRVAYFLQIEENFQAYKDNNWLYILDKELKNHKISSEIYDRFVRNHLDIKRAQVEATITKNIPNIFGNFQYNDYQPQNIRNFCNKTFNTNNGSYKRPNVNFAEECYTIGLAKGEAEAENLLANILEDIKAKPKNLLLLEQYYFLQADLITKPLRASEDSLINFKMKTFAIQKEAASNASEEIKTTFSKANPLNQKDPALFICSDILNSSASQKFGLDDLCNKELQSLHWKKETMLCDQTIKKLGVDADLANAMLYADTKGNIPINRMREILCKMGSKPDSAARIETTGYGWWKEYHFIVTLKTEDGNTSSLNTVLEPIKNEKNSYSFGKITAKGELELIPKNILIDYFYNYLKLL